MQILIKCLAHPTEDTNRVQEAIENLFGSIPFKIFERDDLLEIISTELTTSNLVHIRQIIHDKRIIDAVRARLNRNRDDLHSYILLDKQAAFVGKLRLLDNENENPPLGPIEIDFTFLTESDFEEFLEWFTPPTKDGKIISRE